jgi:hypothetical protein
MRSGGRLLLAVWMLGASSCSLFSRHYDCRDRGDGVDARCGCKATSKLSSIPCKGRYDCCVEATTGGVLADDPGTSYGCYCWMLRAGQTCEGTSGYYSRLGSSIDSRPTTCPP